MLDAPGHKTFVISGGAPAGERPSELHTERRQRGMRRAGEINRDFAGRVLGVRTRRVRWHPPSPTPPARRPNAQSALALSPSLPHDVHSEHGTLDRLDEQVVLLAREVAGYGSSGQRGPYRRRHDRTRRNEPCRTTRQVRGRPCCHGRAAAVMFVQCLRAP